MRLPVGTRAHQIGSVTIVAAEAVIPIVSELIDRHGRLRDWAAVHAVRTFTGRGPTYLVEAAGPRPAWVVRPARRGGEVARILGDRYLRLGPPRPIRELHTSHRARERGIATPEIATCVLYGRGPFYRADIVTVYVPDSADLATIALGPDRPSEAKRIEAWRAAGNLIRVAARARLVHADLNLRNVLISWSHDIARALLLDLDRCRFRAWSMKRDRDAMVNRLHRSRRKLEAATGVKVSRAELAAFDLALG